MVDVEQLRAVRMIAQSGSITAAARELGMSQPGLSRLVERLEDEFDAYLFVRGRKGAELTADGRRLLEFARSTLNDYAMLRASLSGHRSRDGDKHEVVKVAASTTPGEYVLPTVASAFAEVNPGVSIETLITDSSGVANLLLTGEYDAGFTGRKHDFTTLTYISIASDEIVLAVPAEHRFAQASEIEVSDLASERMLHRENGSGTYETVKNILSASGLSLPDGNAVISLGSTQAVVSAVAAGLGIGFVTLRAITYHQSQRISAVRIAGVPVTRDLYLVYESEREASEEARAFVDFVRQMGAEHFT